MKKIITIILIICGAYIAFLFIMKEFIKHGYTNGISIIDIFDTNKLHKGYEIDVIPLENIKVRHYLEKHPDDIYDVVKTYVYLNGTGSHNVEFFPEDVMNHEGFKFVMNGIYTREILLENIKKTSLQLGIDSDLVLSSLLGEQVRISSKGVRGKLKSILLNSTPTLFISYDVSLGVGGIKISTARQIVKDAITYGYGDIVNNHTNLSNSGYENILTTSDYWQAIYPTLLVKNILYRWQLSGYDLSHNPGVVGTLYNMGNNISKIPNKNPQIGGAEISIGNHTYSYGGLSMAIYWYLKIYK